MQNKQLIIAIILGLLSPLSSAVECTQSLKDDTPMSAVGAFSNMLYTEEHAVGYTAELWRAEDCLFGLFFSSAGLIGDTPVGLIENLAFDKASRSISFSSRLTMGVIPAGGTSNAWIPSIDVYKFSGTLGAASLNGSLSHEILNYPGRKTPPSEVVTLPYTADETVTIPEFRTFSEWKAHAQMLLKFRGPKN